MPEVLSWGNLKAPENFCYLWVDRVTQQEIEDVGIGKSLAHKNELFYYSTQQAGKLKTNRPYVRPYLCFNLANIYWTFNVPSTVQNLVIKVKKVWILSSEKQGQGSAGKGRRTHWRDWMREEELLCRSPLCRGFSSVRLFCKGKNVCFWLDSQAQIFLSATCVSLH